MFFVYSVASYVVTRNKIANYVVMPHTPDALP